MKKIAFTLGFLAACVGMYFDKDGLAVFGVSAVLVVLLYEVK